MFNEVVLNLRPLWTQKNRKSRPRAIYAPVGAKMIPGDHFSRVRGPRGMASRTKSQNRRRARNTHGEAAQNTAQPWLVAWKRSGREVKDDPRRLDIVVMGTRWSVSIVGRLGFICGGLERLHYDHSSNHGAMRESAGELPADMTV